MQDIRAKAFREKLFLILRAGLDMVIPAVDLSVEEYDELMQIGINQSVQPILLGGLEKMGTPESVLASCS